VVHKSDVGGVRLGLRHAGDVVDAFDPVAAAGSGRVVVQPMQPPGLELLVGVNRVEPYPPLVVVGLGGTTTELLGDRAARLTPLTPADAREALRELRSAPLLTGYRGRPPVDVAALEDLVVRVGLLADEIPELAELDLNPVIAWSDGVVAVDAKVRLAPVPTDASLFRDPLLRRLR
jgi:acyl-CoA synthetase (NDP forming)